MRIASVAVPIVTALVAFASCGEVVADASDERARSDRLDDFDAFCRFVGDDYAYFDRKRVDWPAACAASRPAAADAVDRAAFIGVVERTLAELYDAHAHLGTSTPCSPRLVPTDGDLYARWQGDAALVVDVRAGSAAAEAGVRPGMRVVEVDGRPVVDAVAAAVPAHLTGPEPAARDWALRAVLAGRQDREPVRVTVEGATKPFAFVPDRRRRAGLLDVERRGGVGVITIHNALGDPKLVAAFDVALDGLGDASAVVLDLRDTPSGGTTGVARGLLGRFVAREAPYQRHERVGEERASGVRHVWVEYVEPRGATFARPVVVLVGHWTGSMGEGIAIGLNAARGTPVLGTPMAGLVGGLDEMLLAHADFVVRIPAEKLFHVDGTPREDFVPCPLAHAFDGDAALDEAVRFAALLATGATPRCPAAR